MPAEFGHSTFVSPFTWRYGSPEMRRIFSDIYRRAAWRKIWVALAEAQFRHGLITKKELDDLKSKMGPEHVDIERAEEIEREIRHDLMAEIRVYAEQCPVGGGKLHMGATSMDIEDNADVMRMREGLDLILTRLVNCLDSISGQIERYGKMPCIGWTHMQPAEPTTVGYRLAGYAQDLLLDIAGVEFLLDNVMRGKGIKGAVGTSAGFLRLLGSHKKVVAMEEHVMKSIGLKAFTVSSQTYPRKIDYLLLSVLAGVAQSVYKFGLDIRHLQSPPIGEVSEPIKKSQVGSSAMPFKRNPITSERMCSLSRYVSVLPQVAWENAAQMVFERTLDDSANRRIIIPEAFLAVDECLILYDFIAGGLVIYDEMVKRNLKKYGPFAATEAVLMKLVMLGENRQTMHEKIRKISFEAWDRVMRGEENPLVEMIKGDRKITSHISPAEIDRLMVPEKHIGDAPEKCRELVNGQIRPVLRKYRARLGKRKRVEF
ncbi:MAG: adenylosuccinate lyase [Candidatus Hadarchaeales archaeon]